LAPQASQLEWLLRERLGWDFRVSACGGERGDAGGSDEGEDAPVVVELSEEQRRMAGLEL
jgi:hypothetical protein